MPATHPCREVQQAGFDVGRDRLHAAHLGQARRGVPGVAPGDDRAGLHKVLIGGDHRTVERAVEVGRHGFLKERRRVSVIGIEETNELASRGIQAREEGADLPHVLVKPDDPDPG